MRTAVKHTLKTIPPYWEMIATGTKRHEVRVDDSRSYQRGDVLILREWEPETEEYTGRELRARISGEVVNLGQWSWFGSPDRPAKMTVSFDIEVEVAAYDLAEEAP